MANTSAYQCRCNPVIFFCPTLRYFWDKIVQNKELYCIPLRKCNLELDMTATEVTGVPSKAHTRQLVKIQPEERLATTSELKPAPSLVTDWCEAGGMGYQAITEVKVISPEISQFSEADVICVTEGSIYITISSNLRSWNIAASSGTRQGDVSPTGSQAVAWYQMEIMGTREAHSALLTVGVCDVKPINGKTL